MCICMYVYIMPLVIQLVYRNATLAVVVASLQAACSSPKRRIKHKARERERGREGGNCQVEV